jgi:hypothetical protein
MEKVVKAGESKSDFERWIKKNTPIRKKDLLPGGRTKSETYQIPVVVHVIHSGVNHPSNISDEQILSQIRVLNDDYKRLNADASNTPAMWTSVAGSLDIEFILAKRTPEGLPTNGIVRVQGPKSEWTVSDNYQLKSLSYWPAEDYFNIWVCNLTDFLGYAQFPQSTLVNGLENASSNRLTDGVVVAHTAFGSIDDGNFNLQSQYNKGRTATHEVGHFFGLRHIWGDDDGACNNDGDYVDDTPDQANSTQNCPSHPRTTCGTISMFQNYLDYTYDACMNLFTQGQAERMSIIIENSPRRKSLLTSPGLLEPEPVANDLGIKTVISPKSGECAGTFTPIVEVVNVGSNTITSAMLQVKKNGNLLQVKTFTLSLTQFASIELAFDPQPINEGTHTFSFEILQTNGTADGNPSNNFLQRSVVVPPSAETPLVESLESVPPEWRILNPDGIFTWENVVAPNANPANRAMSMNFYDYEDNEGEIDVFLSPVIDLSTAPVGILVFDYAYAQYLSSRDGLRIVVLTDCNTDVTKGTVVFSRSGNQLATTSARNEPFVPSSAAEWKTESIILSDFVGQPGVQIAFVGVNDWGNNLYIDNIKIFTEEFTNLTLKKIISPSPMVCQNTTTPRLLVRNSGTNVSSFDVLYSVNDFTGIHSVSGLDFKAGTEMEIQLPAVTLELGAISDFSFSIINPDGGEDLDPSDNTEHIRVAAAVKTTPVPFRETFEGEYTDYWTIINPQGNPNWRIENLGGNKALVYDGFVNNIIGDQAWLISPVFDLSDTDAASIFFDHSYARRNNTSEILEVRASKGCDLPFDLTLSSLSSTGLTDISSNVSWKPAGPDDWKRDTFVNLSALTGQKQVRIAFVVTNRNGNNLYLDNIRLYLSDYMTPVKVENAFGVYPNPAYTSEPVFITFDLAELNDVSIEVIDLTGKILSTSQYTGILNQTVNLDFTRSSGGLYIVRVTAGSEVYHSKIMVY